MSEVSRFYKDGIQHLIRKAAKQSAEQERLQQIEKHRQKEELQRRQEDAQRVEEKWSLRDRPNFEIAKNDGYAKRNASQTGKKGEQHPTISHYRAR